MAIYARPVAFLVDEALGAGKLVGDPNGSWTADKADKLFAMMVDSGYRVSTYSLWLDGLEYTWPESGYWTNKEMKAFAKDVKRIELVLVKHKFPQPKLKLYFGTASATTTNSRKIRL